VDVQAKGMATKASLPKCWNNKANGSVWKSNPLNPLFKGPTGFEDLGRHQPCKHSQGLRSLVFRGSTHIGRAGGEIRPLSGPRCPATPAPQQGRRRLGRLVHQGRRRNVFGPRGRGQPPGREEALRRSPRQGTGRRGRPQAGWTDRGRTDGDRNGPHPPTHPQSRGTGQT